MWDKSKDLENIPSGQVIKNKSYLRKKILTSDPEISKQIQVICLSYFRTAHLMLDQRSF